MSQFLIPKDSIHNGELTLKGPEAKHLCSVMRRGVGDIIDLFDGGGRGFEGRIVNVHSGRVHIKVLSEKKSSRKTGLDVTLALSMIPANAFDELIRQSAELGVNRIVPVISERSIVRFPKPKINTKMIHWKKVLIAACKQSLRLEPPPIEEPVPLSQWLNVRPREELWIAHPAAGALSIFRRMEESKSLAKVQILIGPEGGFSAHEIAQIQEIGGKMVRLGDLILRSQTAALNALSVVNSFKQN